MYTSNTCNLISTVVSNSNLGITTANVTVASNTLIYNTQPYVKRWFEITPHFQGAANITFYFTQNDFTKYNFCKYFLFDSTVAGSGFERDFSFAKNLELTTKKPFFLAGGININNAYGALKFTNMVDISSGIEEVRGVKSLNLMEDIVKSFKKTSL